MSITRIPLAGVARTVATGEVLMALLYRVVGQAAIGVMTVVIAGIGPACVALLLLLL
jgi:hypothetical protein